MSKNTDRRVVLDLETKRTFEEVGGRDHVNKLGITVVGLFNYTNGQYLCFDEVELGSLQNLLIDASLIVGFNHSAFDLPVLQPYLSIDVRTLPVLDIMVECEKKVGHRVGLDSVAKATLGVGKTGHGLDAIRYYREGKIKELREYCLNDVKLTKEIFDYGIQHGKINYLSKIGAQKKEITVDWKHLKNPSPSKDLSPQAQYKLF